MPDYGLLGGIAEGLKAGLSSYQTTRAQAEEEALRRAKEKREQELAEREQMIQGLTLEEKGYERDPNSSAYVPSKGLLSRRERERLEADPESELSKKAFEQAQGAYGKIGLGKDFVSGGLSASEIGKRYGTPKDIAEMAIKLREKQKEPKKDFDQLPKESQIKIETFAKKNAEVENLNNQLKEDLAKMNSKDISQDQKIQIGRGMLKTLNSLATASPDALSKDEAERWGSFLEYKIIPNLTEPGPVIGRDIDAFIKQVAAKSNTIDNLVVKTKVAIDKEYENAGLRPKAQGLIKDKEPPKFISTNDGQRLMWDPTTQRYLPATSQAGASAGF